MGTSLKEAKREILHLCEEVEKHNYHYHVLDSPKISDAEYDRLFRRLLDLEKAYPEFAGSDSPTQKVGAPPLGKFATIRHTLPMLSLNNANDREEMEEFEERIHRFLKSSDPIQYLVEPKIDGVAVELVYENGHLTVGSTRGDGINGEEITLNLKAIRSIPLNLRKGGGTSRDVWRSGVRSFFHTRPSENSIGNEKRRDSLSSPTRAMRQQDH